MIDLHLHLDGSLTPEDILYLGKAAGISLPSTNPETLLPLLQAAPDCKSLGEYLEKFQLPLQVLQTEQNLSLAVYFLLGRLAKAGLLYVEIRFAPQLHLAEGLTQRQVVAAAVEGLNRGIAQFGMPAQLILCCMRFEGNRNANLETVRAAKEFLGKGVCALDLAGGEAAFPVEIFSEVFGLADTLGVPFIIHAGEDAGPENVWQALRLGARRIGHGIHAIEDASLIAELAERKIPLELCFTSNLQTKAAKNVDTYPLRAFLDKGISVTVNTDNMTVSGTDLHREYTLLQTHFGLSTSMLKAIACNGADAAFLPQEEICKLKQQLQQRFAAWL